MVKGKEISEMKIIPFVWSLPPIFLSDIVCSDVLFDTEDVVGSSTYTTVYYPVRLFVCLVLPSRHYAHLGA